MKDTSDEFSSERFDACGTRGPGATADPGASFRIDDCQERDFYPGFCEIHVTVQEPECSSALLELSPAPHNVEVCEVVERHGGQVIQGQFGTTIRLTLGRGDAHWVRDLARAIRWVTRRGQRYSDPNWKWICLRTADSLERFADALSHAGRRGERNGIGSGRRPR